MLTYFLTEDLPFAFLFVNWRLKLLTQLHDLKVLGFPEKPQISHHRQKNSQERLQLKTFVIFMVRIVTHSSVYLPKSGCCDCGAPGLALSVLSGDAQQELICLCLSVGWLCLHTAAGLKLAWTVGRIRRLCCDCSADTYCVSPPKRTEDKWGFVAICIKRFIHCKC